MGQCKGESTQELNRRFMMLKNASWVLFGSMALREHGTAREGCEKLLRERKM